MVDQRFLGGGTYSSVYLLFYKEINALVVGKYFNTGGDLRTIEKDLANAKREAQILATINHESIVKFIGITTKEKTFGIILEYVPCGNLESLLLGSISIPLP